MLRKQDEFGFLGQMCCGVICVDQPQNKNKICCENAAEAGHRVFIENPVLTWAETPLSEEEALTPDLGEGLTLDNGIDFVFGVRTVKWSL